MITDVSYSSAAENEVCNISVNYPNLLIQVKTANASLLLDFYLLLAHANYSG